MIASATAEVDHFDANAGHPKVSIGMPVYNAEAYLSHALDAVLAQTFFDFELIVSDNGSTDRTAEIGRAYAAVDSRVHYERCDSATSTAGNYNRVVELASGEYFKWAAADDLIAPTFLERCVNVLQREPDVVLCYARTRLIDESGTVLGTYSDELDLCSPQPHRRLRQFYENQGLCHPIYGLIRLDVLKRSGRLGELPMADRVLMSELALLGKILELPGYLFLHRIHSGFSARVNAVDVEYQGWYNPRIRAVVHFPRWRRLGEYLNAIHRTKLGMVETIRCYLQLVHFIFIPKRWTGLLMEASSMFTIALQRYSRSSTK
jgi:glycosyltransferase involved in cell wall biosynthesis